ncbi:MAG: PfkB family carbohydrate kinase, partial [Oscillospiraceae bacterium]|nr:PfkB family carbohydrate kinase [Oscillospiraceae bacterium]
KKEIEYGLSKCNILKISDNEIEFLLGHSDYDKAAMQLMEKYKNIRLIFITLGSNGSCAYTRTAKAKAPVYSVKTVEKTGAGDTFFGCALNFILEHDIDFLDETRLTELLRFANAGASLITTRKGALKVMPDMQEISDLMVDEENV